MNDRSRIAILTTLLLVTPAFGLKVGDTAPELGFSDWVKGEEISLGEGTAGKVVVIEWWAVWCGPCKITIPHLTEIQHQYPDDVVVIGATAKDPRNKKRDVKRFVEEYGEKMDYRVAFDSSGRVENEYMRAYGARGIPTVFVIDQDGKLAWVGHPMAGMDEVIEQLLAGEFDPKAHAKADEIVEKLGAAIRKGNEDRISELIPEALAYVGSGDDLGRLAYYILRDPKLKGALAEQSLSMTERANELANGENWRVLDAYALALYENDRIGKAVRTQKKAIMNCDDDRAMKDLKLNLARYEKERERLARN